MSLFGGIYLHRGRALPGNRSCIRRADVCRPFLTAALVLVFASLSSLPAQRFHDSDPMLIDDDSVVDVTEEPEYLELSDMYDRFGHIFVDSGDPDFCESQNINTLDEVPDSSWFTNRHARKQLSLEELEQGANFDGPPGTNEKWHVFRGKSQGVTPGCHIEDSRGDRYVIKFDPPQVQELATAAEAVASKIFYAIGYNVPQNYIVYLDPDNLRIKEGVMVADKFGDAVPLTDFRLKRMLRLIPRRPDGTVRAIASKYIDGKPIGPFRYYGTRSDDPNDVILHEHRRELRGLRLFAAWTNHVDTRAQNTQGTWIERNGKSHIRHYLMDFGATFGSRSVDIQLAHMGFDYSMDFAEMKHNAPSFGFRVPPYRKVKWPDFPKHKAVGRWEAEGFEPGGWHNDYPNPAFVRMTARDAFWAAKILVNFTPEELLTMVKEGHYSHPDDERYFHEVLVKRQQKCARFGINGLNPLDGFKIVDKTLTFANLSERYGFTDPASTIYRVQWHSYDNQHEKTVSSLGQPLESSSATLHLPDVRDKNLFLLAKISSEHPGFPHWADPVDVYLRPVGSSYEVVGIERHTPHKCVAMD